MAPTFFRPNGNFLYAKVPHGKINVVYKCLNYLGPLFLYIEIDLLEIRAKELKNSEIINMVVIKEKYINDERI